MSYTPETVCDCAFLFVDVDGYCTGGIDQRQIVSPDADGYRAREMGWAFFTEQAHASGSIYFRDAFVAPLASADPGVVFVRRMHGLPTHPTAEDFDDELVLCSSRLLDAFRAIHGAVAAVTGLPVVVVHKGGNEGVWARQAIAEVETLDLGRYGCPKVDTIGKEAPHLHHGRQCAFHAPVKRRAKKVVHCPRLEVQLLAAWIAGCTVVCED